MNWVFLQAKFHSELDSEDSTEEETRRKVLFAKTHEMIKKHNSDPKGKPQMAHNHISAMVRTVNNPFIEILITLMIIILFLLLKDSQRKDCPLVRCETN